eukprot:gene24049-57512_t
MCARKINSANIMMKNIMDLVLGGLLWWLVGHQIAYGEEGGSFAGDPFRSGLPSDDAW